MKREKTQITTTRNETRGITTGAVAVKGVRDPTNNNTLVNSTPHKKRTNYSKPTRYRNSSKME